MISHEIGFTGTQQGMSPRQKHVFRQIIGHYAPNVVFHHGDCIGADAEAHDIAFELGCFIVIHQPINEAKRAFKEGHVYRPPKPYLERNHDIVDETQLLLACPKSAEEELRSGTWATIRYSRKLNKQRKIIVP